MRREPFNKWYRFPRRQEDIRLAVDEWNIWNSTPRGENNRYGVKMVYTWRDALWTACMMNTFADYAEDIGITNLAQMVNVLAPIMTDGDDSYVQTTYHVLMLYRALLHGKKVQCRFCSPVMQTGPAGEVPILNAAACRHEDGSTALFLVNISRTDALQIILPDTYVPRRSVRLSAPDFGASNSLTRECVARTEQEEKVRTISVPAGTVCALCLETPDEPTTEEERT